MEKMVYQLAGYLQRMLLTPSCIACGNRGSTKLDLCNSCRDQLVFNTRCCLRCSIPLVVEEAELCGSCLRRPPRYQSSYCAFEYGYPIAELVRTLKYGHSLSHAQVLGTLLAEYLQQHRNQWPQCIMPVPLSTERYLQRGFNQAIELGRVLESQLHIPMNTHLLQRVRHTIEQAGLSRRERRKNLRNAFAVTATEVPTHIAILDDVVTTGSTMNEIARTLRRAGVKQIEVWAVARAPLR
jgi:ComF family protein